MKKPQNVSDKNFTMKKITKNTIMFEGAVKKQYFVVLSYFRELEADSREAYLEIILGTETVYLVKISCPACSGAHWSNCLSLAGHSGPSGRRGRQ